MDDIAKIERFMKGVDHTVFEQDDKVAYAVKYTPLRISENGRHGRRHRRLAIMATPWDTLRLARLQRREFARNPLP